MTTLYFDCGMGAAGDMLTAALLDLFGDEREAMTEALNAIGIPGVRYCLEPSEKCGIQGQHMRVLVHEEEEHTLSHDGHAHHHHHSHSSLADIQHLIGHLHLTPETAQRIERVFLRIAQAESAVHGVPVPQIHFHEVGSMDALADVTAVCFLLERLHPDRILCSPVHVGSGTVSCAHGILPVPAPATERLLRGIPTYGGSIYSELCTPTGAALLAEFAEDFGDMPVMRVMHTGYGMGKKDFARANCVRVMLGEQNTPDSTDTVLELCCNLDDTTPEAIGFAMEQLLAQGALDVFTTAIGMKKNRPGVMLTVLCRPEVREKMVKALFTHTETLGIRELEKKRSILHRRLVQVETPCGKVTKKIADGCGVHREKWEYDDLAAIARREGISLRQAQSLCEAADTHR